MPWKQLSNSHLELLAKLGWQPIPTMPRNGQAFEGLFYSDEGLYPSFWLVKFEGGQLVNAEYPNIIIKPSIVAWRFAGNEKPYPRYIS